jgi:hypothetical protein
MCNLNTVGQILTAVCVTLGPGVTEDRSGGIAEIELGGNWKGEVKEMDIELGGNQR